MLNGEILMTTEQNERIIQLPFSGFFNSIWDAEMDNVIEMDAEYSVEQGVYGPLLDASEIFEATSDAVDWRKAEHNLCLIYVRYVNEIFSRELGIALNLKMEKLISPKFYNFETDRLFAYISLDAVRSLRDLSASHGDAHLRQLITERCTSRSGFSSFYPNDLEDWPEDVADWDHNHLGILLEACLQAMFADDGWEQKVFEDLSCNGHISNAVFGAVDDERFSEALRRAEEHKASEIAFT